MHLMQISKSKKGGGGSAGVAAAVFSRVLGLHARWFHCKWLMVRWDTLQLRPGA